MTLKKFALEYYIYFFLKFLLQITYFHIADRLGFYADGPKVRIIRGGLLKKYIVAKIWSYNQPLAITVQVGCMKPTTTTARYADDDYSSGEDSYKNTSEDENDSDSDEEDKTSKDSKSVDEATPDYNDEEGTTDIGETIESETFKRRSLRNQPRKFAEWWGLRLG